MRTFWHSLDSGIPGHLLRRMCPPQGSDLGVGVGFIPEGGDQEPLCPEKRLHLWGVERDISQISRHLGKVTTCQGNMQREGEVEREKYKTKIVDRVKD